MLVNNIRPDDHIYPSATKSCAILGRSDIGQSIHCLVLKTGYDRDVVVASEFEEALTLFKQAYVKNLGMWNAMLIAFAQHSQTEKVFDLFKQMEGLGIKPNFITFLCVLYACSHTGLVEKGQHYFELMKEYGIEPGGQHYASLVDLFGRAGVDFMGTLNWQIMLLIGFLSWDPSSGLHVLLSNAYAAAGRYEDAAKARKMLRDRGIKKETGLSWVEEGNKVHTFAAGDRSHAKAKEIYRKLEELGDKMERAGYIADTSFVLREVNGEEKNQTIRYHSERELLHLGSLPFHQIGQLEL
ncbi:hypothetical protein GOBAR_AA09921 [Gossypium barbadense]|uniref:Uncharacterized protein n=1 Tax=Gossypium barbadense TaxID=3634 RepID=A0A2P5Y539_GOSBA|nr:hypothetical protein GOBAR_AA09921 [Gossypium barbadense]